MFVKCLFISSLMIILLAEVSLCQQTSAKKLYNDGMRHLERNDRERAYMTFRELVRDFPMSEYADDAHFMIAQYYFDSKNYFQAERQLNILIRNYPDSPHVESAKVYFQRMRARFLEDKVNQAMDRGDYLTAKAFLEEMRSLDLENEATVRKLREVDTIIVNLDRQRQQLEKEKALLEQQVSQIEQAKLEAARLKQEAEELMRQAVNASSQKMSEYEALLDAASARENELESKLSGVKRELDLWRERARKYEALGISGVPIPSMGTDTAQILFEGPGIDPAPMRNEKNVTGNVREKSPSVILLSESVNETTDTSRLELVLGLDLVSEWLPNHYMKFRVDYEPLPDVASMNPTIIYYTTADMDESDTKNYTYRKRIFLAIDRDKVKDYSISAYFIQRK